MSETVLVDRSEGVATITLNRPESMNSLSVELKLALLDVLGEVRDDASARAVVLTGNERAFSTGQDLREHVATLEATANGASPMDTVREHFNPIVSGLALMPKPVVAAVSGMAAGAGASIAFACDFRVAGQSARFLMAFANVGLSVDSGGSWTLPRLIGHARATEMLMLAEPVGSERALEIGLVNAVVPDDRVLVAAHELAARLAAGPTVAYGAIKAALQYGATASLADALEREAELQSVAGVTADHRNATAAFVAKRRPTFDGK